MTDLLQEGDEYILNGKHYVVQNGRAVDITPPNQLADIGQSLVAGVQRGATGIVGLPATINDASARFGHEHGLPSWIFGTAGDMGQSVQANDAMVQRVTGPYHDPQTKAGQYAESIGENLIGALAPGGPLTSAARVIVPGVLGQAASDAVPEDMKPAARFVGNLAGAGSVEAAANIARRPAQAFATYAAGATPHGIAAAQALRQQAAARGINLTTAEALDQVAGTRTNVMQRQIERNPVTRQPMAQYVHGRVEGFGQNVQGVADAISPHAPQDVVTQATAQRAATGAINAERQQAGALARPDYDALATQHMDPADHATLMDYGPYAQAHADVMGSLSPEGILQPTGARIGDLRGLAPNNLAVVNRVAQRMQELEQGARPNVLDPGGNNFTGAQYAGAQNATDQFSSVASSNWNAARAAYANHMQNVVDPMRAGPLGAIAPEGSGMVQQTGGLFPASNIPPGHDASVAQAVQALENQAPGVGGQLVRQHILSTLNDSTKDTAGQVTNEFDTGGNPLGPAKFARDLAGSAYQRADLMAALNNIQNGPQNADELNTLLQIAGAIGKRLPEGSPTMTDMDGLNKMPASLHITDPWNLLEEIAQRTYQRNSYAAILRALTAPADQTTAALSGIMGVPNYHIGSVLAQPLLTGPIPGQAQQQ